jgi:hypothetical protein
LRERGALAERAPAAVEIGRQDLGQLEFAATAEEDPVRALGEHAPL